MIILRKKKDHDYAEELERKMRDLVIAFEIEYLDEQDKDDVYILDSEKKITGEKEMEEWLHQLEAELKWMRSLSGDGCYIDPN